MIKWTGECSLCASVRENYQKSQENKTKMGRLSCDRCAGQASPEVTAAMIMRPVFMLITRDTGAWPRYSLKKLVMVMTRPLWRKTHYRQATGRLITDPLFLLDTWSLSIIYRPYKLLKWISVNSSAAKEKKNGNRK